jgi:NAD(P)-dependent dehydrogenase (short-subunit alcohol dehydrogenase family)
MRFSGSVICVAGGTGGLGRAVTLAFLREGADVIVTFRHDAELAALRRAAGADVSKLTARNVDVTDEASVEGLIEATLTENGRIDAMVSAIGGYAGGSKMWESDSGSLDRMLALNLRPGFLLGRAAAKAMVRQGRGAIVNVAARAAFDHPPGLAAYAASKAAAVALMDSLAADLKGTGVRVNSVLPGIIDTDANRKAMPDGDFAKWPKPEDIAKVILFLCSEEARVIHGAAVPVYGNH